MEKQAENTLDKKYKKLDEFVGQFFLIRYFLCVTNSKNNATKLIKKDEQKQNNLR